MPKTKKPNGAAQDHNTNAPTGLSRWQGRLSITITLAAAIGLFVLVTAGSVLAIGVWLAAKNTYALLSANAHQAVSAASHRVKVHLRPAQQQAKYLAQRISVGTVDPTDRERLGQLLIGSLAAAPQIEAVMFIDRDFKTLLAGRNNKDATVALNEVDYSNDPFIVHAMSKLTRGAFWGAPIWRPATKKTYLNLAFPVLRNGHYLGAIVSVVSIEELSSFVSGPGFQTTGNRFILYGRDHVLAHRLLERGYPGRSANAPLPRLIGFSDPVLGSIWQPKGRFALKLNLPKGTQGHVLNIFENQYVFIYQEITGFAPRPLIVGAYFEAASVTKEVRRMGWALVAGLAALLVSLLIAIVIGHKIAQPIKRISQAATRVGDFEISKINDLDGSVFRELNDQSNAFNAMLGALRWFELYVPRKIVASLIKRGNVAEAISDARAITVMFTDIVGFSTASEGMSASAVADFVNQHFSLIAACIEAEDGTIDKFIGDSVMAFWGAPDEQADSAERACRCALAIGEAIRQDNISRKANGKTPVGIRIGIHTGTVTVGNIGAPGRFNYTIIGDAVNIGQRLEQLGKEVFPGGTEVSILLSGDTAAQVGSAIHPISVGLHQLKGRSGDTEVFTLAPR